MIPTDPDSLYSECLAMLDWHMRLKEGMARRYGEKVHALCGTYPRDFRLPHDDDLSEDC